jgi:hypothetical protein
MPDWMERAETAQPWVIYTYGRTHDGWWPIWSSTRILGRSRIGLECCVCGHTEVVTLRIPRFGPVPEPASDRHPERERFLAIPPPRRTPMAASELTADDLWRWLAACKRCGVPHEYRQPGPCNCCPTCACPARAHWTWASPVDGHSYESRFSASKLAGLRAQWESDRAVPQPTGETLPKTKPLVNAMPSPAGKDDHGRVE